MNNIFSTIATELLSLDYGNLKTEEKIEKKIGYPSKWHPTEGRSAFSLSEAWNCPRKATMQQKILIEKLGFALKMGQKLLFWKVWNLKPQFHEPKGP